MTAAVSTPARRRATADLGFIRRAPGCFDVVGGRTPYELRLEPQAPHLCRCSCPGWQYRKRCRHGDELLRRQRHYAAVSQPALAALRQAVQAHVAAVAVGL